MKRIAPSKKWPHVVRLPPKSESPTGSIYRTHDIVSQETALNVINNCMMAGRTLRSAKPFVVRVRVGNKIKNIASKLESKEK